MVPAQESLLLMSMMMLMLLLMMFLHNLVVFYLTIPNLSLSLSPDIFCIS